MISLLQFFNEYFDAMNKERPELGPHIPEFDRGTDEKLFLVTTDESKPQWFKYEILLRAKEEK